LLSYQEEQECDPSSPYVYLTGERLEATVIFKYRSLGATPRRSRRSVTLMSRLDVLVAQDIAPRSALPARAQSPATTSPSNARGKKRNEGGPGDVIDVDFIACLDLDGEEKMLRVSFCLALVRMEE
jgi:hypothetical protein